MSWEEKKKYTLSWHTEKWQILKSIFWLIIAREINFSSLSKRANWTYNIMSYCVEFIEPQLEEFWEFIWYKFL